MLSHNAAASSSEYKHGDPDLVWVEPVAAAVLRTGDQIPGVPDRLGFEVVAEGEVAVHLEERGMPGGLADLVDVEGPNALLHACCAVERRRLSSGEVPLEGHHAGIDEQQGGIVVQQRCGRHDFVVTGGEEIQEAAPNLGGFHDRGPWVVNRVRASVEGVAHRVGRATRGAPFRARPYRLVTDRRTPGPTGLRRSRMRQRDDRWPPDLSS